MKQTKWMILISIVVGFFTGSLIVKGQEATKTIKYQYDHQVNDQRILIETPVYGISRFVLEALDPAILSPLKQESDQPIERLRIQAKDIQLKTVTECPSCSLRMKVDRPVDKVFFLDEVSKQQHDLEFQAINGILSVPISQLGIYGFVYKPASNDSINASTKNYIGSNSFTAFTKGIVMGVLLTCLYLVYKHKYPKRPLDDGMSQ